MPTSAWGYVTPILDKISELHTDSPIKDILDVGCGGGKWGFLSRDLIDFYHNSVYFKPEWELNIEGVEAFEKYRSPIYDFIYNKIYYKPIQELMLDKEYDIIFFMEVIEHLEKEEGKKVLDLLVSKARKGIFLSFPPEYDALGRHIFEQQDTHHNVYETHRSIWTEVDLAKYNFEKIYFNTYFIYKNNVAITPEEKTGALEKDNFIVLVEKNAELKYPIDAACRNITISTLKHPWSGTVIILNDKNEIIYTTSLYTDEKSKAFDIYIKNDGYEFIKIRKVDSQGNEVWIKKVSLSF